MKHEIIKSVYDSINNTMPDNHKFGYGDGNSRYFYEDKQIARFLTNGIDVNGISQTLYGKDLIEWDILQQKQYRLYDFVDGYEGDLELTPKTILFNKMLRVFLYKDIVSFDERGRPLEVIYYNDESKTQKIVKRTWEFIDFNVASIMAMLSVDNATATMMADDLVWVRKEHFHWAYVDGNWSTDVKTKEENYMPFVSGMPDYRSHYRRRVGERKTARRGILDRIQPIVSGYIANGLATTDLKVIRKAGRKFLREYSSGFYDYIQTGDEEVINNIILDSTTAMLDYPTELPSVDVRKFLVNTLLQTGDLTLDIAVSE